MSNSVYVYYITRNIICNCYFYILVGFYFLSLKKVVAGL